MENSKRPTMSGIKKIEINIRKNGRIIIKIKCNEILYIVLFFTNSIFTTFHLYTFYFSHIFDNINLYNFYTFSKVKFSNSLEYS